ncbi:MAG TPA: rhomboid family intramembrane serine protease [Candidatus Binatia bacterium]
MSKARAMLPLNLTTEQARRAMLSLLAMGLDARTHRAGDERIEPAEAQRTARDDVQPESSEEAPAGPAEARPSHDSSSRLWIISVDEDELGAALPLVEEAIAPVQEAPAPPPLFLGQHATDGIWTRRNAAAGFAIAAVCIIVHALVHEGEDTIPRSAMIAAGAVAPWLVTQGQWWRLVTAIFLHFDIRHLVGNMSALLLLGPPLAATIGQLRFVLLFLVTGFTGNVVSQLFGDEAAVKAGASGGICGILGAMAGVALATMAAATDARERRPAWQTLGALAALFGMIVGFEPGRDHYAHLGGLLSGLAVGRIIGPAAGNTAT